MKVGDLVINRNSESRMTGLVIGWRIEEGIDPQVLWADGRCNWILLRNIEKVEKDESR